MASDRLNDLTRLRARIAEVKAHIAGLLAELSKLEGESAWQLVSSLKDQEGYFVQQEKALAEVCTSLERQVREAQYDAVA